MEIKSSGNAKGKISFNKPNYKYPIFEMNEKRHFKGAKKKTIYTMCDKPERRGWKKTTHGRGEKK